MTKRSQVLRGIGALIFWTAAVLLFFNTMGTIVGGYFREFWLYIALFTSAFFVLVVKCVRGLCLQPEPGSAGNGLLHQPIDTKGATTLSQSNEQPVISNPSQVIIQNPENVTVNHTETHNKVQGGIIGSGTVTVHQHFGNQQPSATVPDDKTVQAVEIVDSEDAANIGDLHDYAETLLGRALAGNTVRNVLDRAKIDSCGNEKRGRALAKLYPKKKALSAIAEYVAANK